MKDVIDNKENIAKDSVPNWIYEYYTHKETCELFEEVEEALGFKLFTWQKSYIETGAFRRFGETTAKCLKILLDVNNTPLDYSTKPTSIREKFFREELKNIKEKLDAAGIETRTIFWCIKDRREYKRNDSVDALSTACKWIHDNCHRF